MQITFDSYTKQKFKIKQPIRLIELFAGIGSQAQALRNIGADFEHWFVCEWDKYAIKSYNAIHGTAFETSDITKLSGADLNISDTEQATYICTYSYPCTSVSKAGKREGMTKESGTASALLWEVERLLLEMKELPQVLLLENVTQIYNEDNIRDFQKWCLSLEKMGYSNYIAEMNAKSYNVPQNRSRCFMVSVFNQYFFEFPKPLPLEKCIFDILESNVDKKYYFPEGVQQFFCPEQMNIGIENKHAQILEVFNLYDLGMKGYTRMTGAVMHPCGISPTLRANSGGNSEIKIIEPQTVDLVGGGTQDNAQRKLASYGAK